jgi:hypothetical protein
MPFKDVEIKRGSFDNFRRTQFMDLSQGAHTVRILQEQAKTLPTHFFLASKATALCLGDDCPICANNKKIIIEHPDDFRDVREYNKINYRFFVNVYDKTPAKVCGKCGKEHKNLAATICSCGEVLPQALPLNKVKVLSKGLTLRDDLDNIDRAILDPDGTPLGLTKYDIILMVTGTGRDTKVTPIPRTELNQPVSVVEELYELEKCTIVLSPTELLDVQRGVSLKDIFTARKAKEAPVDVAVPQAVIDQVNDEVNKLFSQ